MLVLSLLAVCGGGQVLQAQSRPAPQQPAPAPAPTAKPVAPPAPATQTPPAGGTVVPPNTSPDYVVGPGDVLAIIVWRQNDMSAEVVVRPDGKISVPLINDIDVNGLTPLQVQEKITKDAEKFVQDPNVSVMVKQINSRRVFITGQVARPGPYPLLGTMNVLQLISTAGGLMEYADESKILIMRTEGGKTLTIPFNYKEIVNKKNLKQNIDLKPNDTIIVP
jgi:polysaccharide export outer membrane protein